MFFTQISHWLPECKVLQSPWLEYSDSNDTYSIPSWQCLAHCGHREVQFYPLREEEQWKIVVSLVLRRGDCHTTEIHSRGNLKIGLEKVPQASLEPEFIVGGTYLGVTDANTKYCVVQSKWVRKGFIWLTLPTS